MSPLTSQTLPHEFPRQFVPASADLGQWSQVEPLFSELQNRSLSSQADLEKWLKNWGEFESALDEEGSLRYIQMTCKTDDPEIEKKYLEFLEKVAEPSKPKTFELLRKYWECP